MAVEFFNTKFHHDRWCMRVRNWCVCWAYESGAGACTDHMRQVLMRAQSAKNSEQTHQELLRTLSVRVRYWCVRWAYESGTDAYPEHQFLTRMLSISIKIPNLKRSLQSMLSMRVRNRCKCWRTRKELMRMLSIRISSLRICSACASETKWGLAPPKIKITS